MRSYVPKPDDITREWRVLDASEHVLGRLATEAARLLRGKHRADFTPHLDTGDFVVVINADKLKVTGDKMNDKLYYRHSGRPGSLRVESLEERMVKYPERVIRDAVWGMLPKNRLGRKLLRKLKVYRGADHPHEAQQPKIHSW
ncbi:MAG: 50S ribosomal protein L13 [Holophagae bacterium]|jgi:large subunit ribosomal protein L13|nr:MAG: 50S ribosomal protein L13 [Holophagae bacterium]